MFSKGYFLFSSIFVAVFVFAIFKILGINFKGNLIWIVIASVLGGFLQMKIYLLKNTNRFLKVVYSFLAFVLTIGLFIYGLAMISGPSVPD